LYTTLYIVVGPSRAQYVGTVKKGAITSLIAQELVQGMRLEHDGAVEQIKSLVIKPIKVISEEALADNMTKAKVVEHLKWTHRVMNSSQERMAELYE
jgi:hypothetical protein